MSELPGRPRRIWLRSFYYLDPEEEGFIGWTDQGHRDRMLGLVEDGDLFMIYGAVNAETEQRHRSRILGFLQIEKRAIRDTDKASAAATDRKRKKGWGDRWTYAMPVIRAWRAEESILLERIATKTYSPEIGQAIAAWSPPLLAEEVDQALKIKVTEVSVFGEAPVPADAPKETRFAEAFRPSRAFPGSFGPRTSLYEDGPTLMYMARFDGDGWALLGRPRPRFDKYVLLKIGVSNDQSRRASELNGGFPPACIGNWKMTLLSEPFADRRAAESAEKMFKDKAEKQLKSLGGEFFLGDLTQAEAIFSQIPGVSRFGR